MALRASPKGSLRTPRSGALDLQLPMLDGYGEKPCETVMSSNGTSGAHLCSEFCMALAAYVREILPITRPSSR